jgi:hypothetical protein
MGNSSIIRRTVASFTNVAKKIDGVIVPRSEVGLHEVAANPALDIEAHYHRGIAIKGKDGRLIIVNCHYYGCNRDDLGHTVNFNVEVIEKTVGGKTFTLVDLYKVDGKSKADLKFFLENHQSVGGGNIAIQGTNAFIGTVSRQKKIAEVAEVAMVA